MSSDELEPDIPARDLDEYATLPQTDMIHRMEPFKWVVSHLWRRDLGDICVWMIAKTPGGKGYTQGYINPDGSFERYTPKRIRIPGRGGDDEI